MAKHSHIASGTLRSTKKEISINDYFKLQIAASQGFI